MLASTSAATRSLSRDESPRAPRPTEQDPLLGSSSAQRSEQTKKPWYRPRPLWLVPFAITASLCRGMTIAPRTEVFIQLACEELRMRNHGHTSRHHHTHSLAHMNYSVPRLPIYSDLDVSQSFILDYTPAPRIPSVEVPSHGRTLQNMDTSTEGDPPIKCLADPRVQSGAAKLQTITTTTMGLLSALTTGWWGQFGDQHGRTTVIATAVFGLLFTDLMFIVASNPPEIFRGHAHQLLLASPVLEGLFGGWSTLQGATQAYISDCTSNGSRAQIFSRFTGVFYIGFALGPEIAAIILRSTHSTTLVFYTSAICAIVNLFLLLFVFPEALSAEARTRNVEAVRNARNKAAQKAQGKKKGLWTSTKIAIKSFVAPLGILGPKPRQHGRGQDWSLTLLAMAMFCSFLSVGLFQIRYLYAKHVFAWDAETLSYYITTAGSMRALHLLLILPTAIRMLKPIPGTPTSNSNPKKKVKPTPKALLSEIKFDLVVAKVSTVLDMLSQVLVTMASTSSEGLFVGFSLISSFGAGVVPALQSVAMCTLHLREEVGQGQAASNKTSAEIGRLFGTFAVMQAVGSMILGPLLFGAVYGLTVGAYPKTVFLVAAGLLVVSMVMLMLIRPPRVDVPIEIRVDRQVQVDVERGRSRTSKDIGSVLQGDVVV